MEIFRNDKLIGYNSYFFKKNKNTTLVTNQIKFAVNILGATLLEVEGYGEELYNEDEEYDIKYGDNLYNIERIFKNIIKNEGLPFLNKFNFTYSFYDFIKFNSVEYGEIIDEVEKLNKEVDINDSNDEYCYSYVIEDTSSGNVSKILTCDT